MISVIVPVYNVAAYLPRCLKSLDEQTEQDIEFIIVNDGSTDGSDKICEEFIKGKEKFRYFSKENGGLMSAWMEGVKHVRGDYVGFVDSDDYIELDMYKCLNEKAKIYAADMVMCKCIYETVDKNNDIISQTLQENAISEGFYNEGKLEQIRTKMLPKAATNYISPSRCNKIIKRNVLEANLKYCDRFIVSGEDVNIIIPCFFSINSFYYIDEAKYHYVKNMESITNTYKPTLKEQYHRLIERLLLAKEDYHIAISDDEWRQTVNSYGMMLLRMTLNSSLLKREKQAVIKELLNDKLFLKTARETNIKICNKWEKAYIKSMKYKNSLSFQFLLFLSNIKNKIRKL